MSGVIFCRWGVRPSPVASRNNNNDFYTTENVSLDNKEMIILYF
jgi:hypothetical protein